MVSVRPGSILISAILAVAIFISSGASAETPGICEGIKSLNTRWHYFSYEEQKYLPYIPGIQNDEKIFILPVSRAEFRGLRLCISLPGESNFFINGKYFGSTAVKMAMQFGLDSLFLIFPGDTLKFTIQLKNKNAEELFAAILSTRGPVEKKQNAGIELNIRMGTTGFNEFIIIGLLVGVGFISFLIRSDLKRFGHYINITRVLGRPETDDLLERGRPMAGNDLFFVILEAVLLGFFIYIILYTGKSDYSEEPFRMLKGIFHWLIISVIVMLWSILKFSLERYLAGIMQLKEIIKIHFFESNRISIFSLIVCAFLSLILLYGVSLDLDIYHGILLKSLVVIAFTKFFLISIKILNYTPYKKMYIISYLCTSELLPVIIGLKIILNSSLSQLL